MTTTKIPNDAIAVIPVSFVDALGRPAAAPADISFVSATAGVDTLTFDGSNLTITPVADGSDVVTVVGLDGEFDLTVSAPVAVGVVFGTPVFSPKP